MIARVALAGLGLALVLAPPADRRAQPRAAAAPRLAYAYLASGKVVAVSPLSGRVVASRTVGPAPKPPLPTQLLARSPDGAAVYALTARRAGRPQHIVALGAADLRVRARVQLPGDTEFTALAVGPRTGTVHAAGTRGGAPVLAGADGALERVTAAAQLRPAEGRRWMVIAAAIDAAERRLLVSYHGESTTGADVVDLATGALAACSTELKPGLGCLRQVHGAAAFAGDALIATTGVPEILVFDAAGRIERRARSRLPGNHLMALAGDPDRGVFVMAGSCQHSGGLSILDTDGGRARVRGHPARPRRRGYRGVCGDSVAVRDGWAVVGVPGSTDRLDRRPAGLFLVDLRPGGARRFVRAGSALAVVI